MPNSKFTFWPAAGITPEEVIPKVILRNRFSREKFYKSSIERHFLYETYRSFHILIPASDMAYVQHLHDWNMTPGEAIELQKDLRDRVRIAPLSGRIETVAGADISFNKYSPIMYAGIVVLRVDSLEVLEEVAIVSETTFPYVPGLLSFREAPSLLEAWRKLSIEPDALMVDGHGIAHPRGFGIASHLGLWIERPSFGCAKSVLVGRFEDPPIERGESTPLIAGGKQVGAAVRTKRKVQPIYVSAGHMIDLPHAVELTLACDGGYRQPEPTRLAHHLVNALRRGERKPT